ncbi:hypothetical protein [Mycetohabitans sp. B2]
MTLFNTLASVMSSSRSGRRKRCCSATCRSNKRCLPIEPGPGAPS